MTYTGIGSRATPNKWLKAMERVATILSSAGYVLRSGGADGADSAFEAGSTSSTKTIFIPWEGVNGTSSQQEGIFSGVCDKAMSMAESIHPAWERCSRGARSLHARNIYQVLGKDLASPSDFLLCYTEGGKKIGGTATAIRLAEANGVKVYNFGNPDDVKEFHTLLKEITLSII